MTPRKHDPLPPHTHDLMGRLTSAERRVLTMMATGLTAAAMAARLGISPRTVNKHQEHLYRKLGTRDRLETVLRAKSMGLLPG